MKISQVLTLAVVLSVSGIGSLSLAAADKKPCKAIESACAAAGFTKGGHKKLKKGLRVDCMRPLLEGKSVEGVTVSAEDVTACKAKKAHVGAP